MHLYSIDYSQVKRNKIAIALLTSLLLNSACERSTETIDNPGIPPAVPIGLRVYYASDGEVTIDWQSNSENDVTGYNIYRRTDSTESTKIAYTSDSYYFDDSLSYNVTYHYKITAVSLWDRESGFSDEVSATPINRYRPQKPTGLQINARNWEGEISIFLKWATGYESDVKGYNIYKSNLPGFASDSSNFIAFTSGVNFSDTLNIDLYTNYYYRIRAVGVYNEFLIKAIQVPASYRIGLQTNKYFGEIWSATIETDVTDDTLRINFNPYSLQFYKTYYWRVATYSGNSQDPNSISKLFAVTFKD